MLEEDDGWEEREERAGERAAEWVEWAEWREWLERLEWRSEDLEEEEEEERVGERMGAPPLPCGEAGGEWSEGGRRAADTRAAPAWRRLAWSRGERGEREAGERAEEAGERAEEAGERAEGESAALAELALDVPSSPARAPRPRRDGARLVE
jgi:hypothetical protein